MPRIAAASFVSIALLCSCDDAGSPEPASSVLVEPRTIDFGRYSSCDPPGPMPVRIVNGGARSLAVGGWSSTCRCVTANFGGVSEIEPGEHLDVAVTLAPWGMPGPHGHDLVLLVGSPPEEIRIRVAYRMDPEVFVDEPHRSRSRNPSGAIVFTSIDGRPFRVLSIDLPIPFEPSEAPSIAPSIEIPWVMLDAIAAGEPVEGLEAEASEEIRRRMRRHPDGRWRSLWLRAETDHPVCGDVPFGLSNDLVADSAGQG
jgi:hypothetical protein